MRSRYKAQKRSASVKKYAEYFFGLIVGSFAAVKWR